jgi:hypothetical protein
MNRAELYNEISGIEKKVHEAKEALEILAHDHPSHGELDRAMRDAHDNLDVAWNILAGICNRMDDGAFPEIE